MSAPYRKTVTRYTLDGKYRDSEGKPVTSRTPGATRVTSQTAAWYGWIAGREERLSEDYDAARTILLQRLARSDLERNGIVDPYQPHRSRPIGDHLADYLAHLRAKGVTSKHLGIVTTHVQAVIAHGKLTLLSDLTSSVVVDCLSSLRVGREIGHVPRRPTWTGPEITATLGIPTSTIHRLTRTYRLAYEGETRTRTYPLATVRRMAELVSARPISSRTWNAYVTAMRSFTGWLLRERRIPHDPLSTLTRRNARADRRRVRMALPVGSLTKLLDAAERLPPLCGITGPARRVLYLLAVHTGLRVSELASLTPASFTWGKAPTVTVQACHSKHRREDVLPLRADVAETIRTFTRGMPATAPLWPNTRGWTCRAAELLRRDLRAAGLPDRDEQGRILDFHALRHTFASGLAAAGVHPKIAQTLLRHSTIELTLGTYTDPSGLDVRGALDRLP